LKSPFPARRIPVNRATQVREIEKTGLTPSSPSTGQEKALREAFLAVILGGLCGLLDVAQDPLESLISLSPQGEEMKARATP
ncbi:MAG: hypothetical protein MK138_13750, partial [Planctomycetes bacterium]|nr:hypothetical protein [Planctomycetota bacterium]